jgi:hypothetical protein
MKGKTAYMIGNKAVSIPQNKNGADDKKDHAQKASHAHRPGLDNQNAEMIQHDCRGQLGADDQGHHRRHAQM